MKKKEIQAMTNAELIYLLSALMVEGNRVLKRCVNTAKMICEELKKRGIIDDDTLYDKWLDRYMI